MSDFYELHKKMVQKYGSGTNVEKKEKKTPTISTKQEKPREAFTTSSGTKTDAYKSFMTLHNAISKDLAKAKVVSTAEGYAPDKPAVISSKATGQAKPQSKVPNALTFSPTKSRQEYDTDILASKNELSTLEKIVNYKPNAGTFLMNTYTMSPAAAAAQKAAAQDEVARQYGYDSWNAARNRYETLQAETKQMEREKRYGFLPDEEDYDYYTMLGGSVQNPEMDDVERWIGGKEVGNIVTYSRANADKIAIGESNNSRMKGRSIYQYMTDQEVDNYDYLLAKEGAESAQDYLDFLEPDLQTRQAEPWTESLQSIQNPVGKAAAQGAFGFAAGVDRAMSGYQQLGKSEAIPTSAIQQTSQNIQRDMGEVGRVFYSAAENIGNMAPSILASSLLGGVGVAPKVAQAAGSIAMGTSVGGNAYKQAIEDGYGQTQAAAYGTLVGVSETTLQSILGGIGALGGISEIKLVSKLSNIDNALLRTAARFGVDLVGEISEEELQNYLEPAFRTILFGEDYDAPTIEEVIETALVTALTVGVMEGPANIAETISEETERNAMYREAAPDLVAEAREIGSDTSIADRVQEQLNTGKKVASRDLRALVKSNDATKESKYVAQAEARLAELGETENAPEVAKVIVKMMTGQKLSRNELQVFRQSKNAADIMNALAATEGTTAIEEDNAPALAKAEQAETTMMQNTTKTAQEAQIPEAMQVEGETEKVAPVANLPKETDAEAITNEAATEEAYQPDVLEEDAADIDTFAKQYANPTAYKATFQGNQDPTQYDVAYRAAYEMGMTGEPEAQMKRSKAVQYLTQEQQIDAYREGEAVAKAQAESAEAFLRSKGTRTGERKRGNVKAIGGVNVKKLTTKFNDSQRKAYRILDRIAEVTGINIVLYESQVGENGQFEGEQGRFARSTPDTIYIDINAGLSGVSDVGNMAKYTMLATFSHEFTHFCEAWNPIRYNELRKLVFDTMEAKGVSVEDRIDSLMQEDSTLTRDAASREVVAEAMVDILPDANFIEQLATKHQSLFQKLVERLKEFLASIRDLFNGMEKSEYASVLKEELDGTVRYMESIVKLFDNVAVEAVETMQNIQDESLEISQEEWEAMGGTQFQRRMGVPSAADTFAKEIDAWNRGELPNNTDFIMDSTGEVLQGLGAVESDIYINGAKIKKILRDHPEMTLAEIKKIPQILRNPTVILKSGNDVGTTDANTRILIFGTVKATNRQPVMTVLDLRPMQKKLVIEGMQKISSAYTKTNSPVRFIEKSQIVYADKNKTTKLLRTIGFQLPIPLQSSGYIGSITYDGDFVKVQGVPFDEVFTDGDVQKQRRSAPKMSDLEVLEMAAEGLEGLSLTEAESNSLGILRKKLADIAPISEEIDLHEQNAETYAESDPDFAQKERNRAATLKAKRTRKETAILAGANGPIMRRVLQKARLLVESSERAEYREKLDKLRAEHRESEREKLAEYRAKRNESELAKRYKAKIEKDVRELITWGLKPDTKNALKHIPEGVKGPVMDFLEAIDFSSKRKLKGGADTKQDIKLAAKLRAIKRALDGGTRSVVSEDYKNVTLSEAFFERIENLITEVDNMAIRVADMDAVLNEMSAEGLKNLSDLVKNLKKLLTDFNTFHKNEMFAHVYEAGRESTDFLRSMKPIGAQSKFMDWDLVRPAYVWERFGKGGESIWKELVQAQSDQAFHTKEIADFANRTYTAQEVREWEKDVRTIKLSDDSEVQMTIAQIMAVYKLRERQQALGHLLGQGLRIPKTAGIKKADEGHFLTEDDLDAICAELNERQKAVADKLQRYMQDKGSEWGNQVTMVRFGEKLFGEPNYYPIHIDSTEKSQTLDAQRKAQDPYALLNMGFTKQTQENASNRLVVYSIFDEFSTHMANMATYNAYALPVIDAIKWFNYSEGTGQGVRSQLARVYGRAKGNGTNEGAAFAEQWILNQIKAINGTNNAPMTIPEKVINKATSTYNRAQIAANLSVVIQQPFSVIRSTNIISPVSLAAGEIKKWQELSTVWKEMDKHSGIALWKQMGFYDVNISRGLSEMIKHDKSVGDKVADTSMKLAEWMDRWAWATLWQACKHEVEHKQNIKPSDDRYWNAVDDLFNAVIYKTQVVDSSLSKPEFMTSKSVATRPFTAFMSEPLTAFNNLADPIFKYRITAATEGKGKSWKKHKGAILRGFAVYASTALIQAMNTAIRDAWRDDDEYATFGEKWLDSFKGNLWEEINPIAKLPWIADIFTSTMTILKDNNLTDIDVFESSTAMQSLVDLGNKLIRQHTKDTSYTSYGKLYNWLKAISGVSGLPFANAMREVVSVWNNTVGAMYPDKKLTTYDAGDEADIREAFENGYLTEKEAIKALEDKQVKTSSGEDVNYEAKVEFWKYKQAHPKAETSYASMEAWVSNGIKEAGLSFETYSDYCAKVKDAEEKLQSLPKDKRTNGDTKEAVLKIIDNMKITDKQKDTLYFARYTKSTLDEAPWH